MDIFLKQLPILTDYISNIIHAIDDILWNILITQDQCNEIHSLYSKKDAGVVIFKTSNISINSPLEIRTISCMM